MRRKCRLWWPKQLLSSRESSSSFLLGWFVTSSPASLDIVVAFTCSEVVLSHSNPCLEEILHDTNWNMPIILQEKSMFSLLGQCVTDPSNNSLMVGTENSKRKLSNCLDKIRQDSLGKKNWILLTFDSSEQNDTRIHELPKLHYFHWNGLTVSQYDIHVIVYDKPFYGVHHFSLCFSSSHEQVKASTKKPKWVDELHKKQQLIDLDTVILAINCSAAAQRNVERHVVLKRSFSLFSIFLVIFTFIGNLFAKFVASFSTLFFIVLQFVERLFNNESGSWIYMALSNIFRTAWINIHIRCCQILYWPIFLQENDLRSQSCVEYAEKAAMHRHSLWSTLIVDVLMGNLVGWALLYHAESVCLSVLDFVHDIANPFLRSGCVWLMGNPAGFKLNTELAGVLGLVSLNAIQIWSTLWIFVGLIFNYIIQGLAIIGILCGFTLPAALIIDMIVLATSHVSTLYWLISLLYSSQLQAVAALWRLFRGRKWNPLRQRLDSFDYTVKQHIVGSLLFTPLLLLLPTTSVFYIFFSIVDTIINLICLSIEVTISVIHATPYIKFFLWLIRPGRFPSGIWFEILGCQSNSIAPPIVDFADDMTCSDKESLLKDINREKSSILVSVLHSNYLSIGKVFWPHYKNVFLGFSGSSISTIAYGILIGRRMPYRRGTLLPSPMPWMSLPYKEYWHLCHDSLIACFRF